MISFILSTLPFLFIIVYLTVLKRNGGLGIFGKKLLLKRNGESCYMCSSPILDETACNEHVSLCKSCIRDNKISSIVKPSWFSFKNFNKFVFTNKFEKILLIIFLLGLSSVIMGIIFYFCKIKFPIYIITNSFLSLYWSGLLYRLIVVYK